jgi:hypothetical protein
MGAVWRACGARHGHGDGAAIVRADEQFKFPPLPRDRYPSPGHPLPGLPPHRPAGPGTLSQVLTGHYRRLTPKRPASRPGSRPQSPALSADAAAGPGRTCHRARPEDASGHRPWPIHGDGTHKEPPNGAPTVSLQEFVCAAPNVAFCAEADDVGGNADLRSRP